MSLERQVMGAGRQGPAGGMFSTSETPEVAHRTPPQASLLSTMFRTFCAALALAGLAGCGPAKAGKIASQAADSFHQQYNESKFVEIYRAASPGFRKITSQAEFVRSIEANRRRFGRYLGPNRTGWSARTRSSKGVSAGSGWKSESGTTVVLRWTSSFERGSATETLTFTVTGGQATLEDYRVEGVIDRPDRPGSRPPSGDVI